MYGIREAESSVISAKVLWCSPEVGCLVMSQPLQLVVFHLWRGNSDLCRPMQWCCTRVHANVSLLYCTVTIAMYVVSNRHRQLHTHSVQTGVS